MRKIILVLSMSVAVAACSTQEREVALQQCGAPQPDAIGLNPDGSLATLNKSNPNDAKEKLGLIGANGQVAEVVRQMSWQLCNARTNNWVDDEYYRRELTAMREAAFQSFGGEKKPANGDTRASSTTTPARMSSADMQACLSAAGESSSKQAACYKE